LFGYGCAKGQEVPGTECFVYDDLTDAEKESINSYHKLNAEMKQWMVTSKAEIDKYELEIS